MGPSSSPREVLKEMFIAGLNVCRVNFSHGSYDQHAEVIRTVRELNEELGANVAVLADLQGPKIRTGEMENNGVMLEVGASCQIITENILGTAERFSINYTNLPKDVSQGEKILLDDGKLILEVLSSDKKSTIKNQKQIINSQTRENMALVDKNTLLHVDLNLANDEIEHQKDLKRIIASFGAGLIVVILIIL